MGAASAVTARARYAAWMLYFATILAAWSLLIGQAAARGDWLCGPGTIAVLPLGGFVTLFAMWALMMAAMMLPTILPVMTAYARLPSASGAGTGGLVALAGGYGGVWLIGAALCAVLQLAAIHLGLLPGGRAGTWLQIGLLALAGGWQFTRAKTICQTACLTPQAYFIGRFRPGIAGGWTMGVEFGLTCIGCCWALMLLGLAGAMSLWWMGLATAFMVAEKLPALGLRLRRPAGLVLLGAAAYVALDTAGLGG